MLLKLVLVLLFTNLIIAEISRQKDGASPFVKSNARSKTKSVRHRTVMFDDLFNVYDTTFLAAVWPKLKNGVHLNLEPLCWDNLSLFYKHLLEGKPWAYNVVDASGRYQSGVFEGNRFWIGSKQECNHLNKSFTRMYSNESLTEGNNKKRKFILREKYFDSGSEEDWHILSQREEMTPQLMIDSTPPFSLSFNTAKVTLNITKAAMVKSHVITLGICFPKSCKAKEIHKILNFAIMITDHLKTNKTVPRTVQITSVRQIDEIYNLINDATALVLMFFTISLLIVILLATAVDFELIRIRARNFRSMSFDIQKMDVNLPLKINEVNSKPNNNVEIHRKCLYEIPMPVPILPTKETNLVGTKTLKINSVNNSNKINLVSLKKNMKSDVKPPSITLDVIAVDEIKNDSCNRCGKYRKQCGASPRKLDNLPACPRMKYNNSFGSFSTENQIKCKRNYFFKSILLCFSLRYSWRRICNRNLTNRNLAIVQGLKVVATFWIIFVHVTLIVFYLAENAEGNTINNTAYNILATGTLAFDTLFFVSGVLSSHHFFYLKSRYTLEELVSFRGHFGHILQFICFVTNRAVRLLPPYAYTIFLGAVLSRALNMTSLFELPDRDHSTCDRYWWRNILYITNFYSDEDKCMQISWFLSLETQLHALGTLLLCFAPGRGGAAVMAICVVMATIATDIITAWKDRLLVWTGPYAAYATLIERPWARVTPYFVGVLTGWIIQKLDGKLPLSRCKASLLWIVTLLALPATMIRPWFASQLGILDVALSALAHGFWTMALSWPTVVLATKCTVSLKHKYLLAVSNHGIREHGSVLIKVNNSINTRTMTSGKFVLPRVTNYYDDRTLKKRWPYLLNGLPEVIRDFAHAVLDHSVIAALSRLSYAMLLLNGILVRYLLLSVETALSMDFASLFSYYTGATMFTVFGALTLSLLVETPCCSLLRRLSDCTNVNT